MLAASKIGRTGKMQGDNTVIKPARNEKERRRIITIFRPKNIQIISISEG
jgi:hypothetical protein